MSCKITICMLIMLAAVCSAATYDYCDVLSKSLLFYEAQRSGRLPSNNRIPWRSNSALSDATSSSAATDSNGDGNLAGGYYDAGDGVKFGYPMAFTATTLAWGFIESESAIAACGQTDNYLAAIKWATDWFIKAHTAPNEFWGQVGNGGLDHSFWGPPEQMTMSRPAYKIDASRPGTDLAMEVAAALAAASIVFKNRNPTYSATLLTHARQMYTFGYTYRGLYHDSIPDAAIYYRSYGFNDELVWGSSWLYRATQEASYLTAAQNDYNTFGMAYMAPGQSFDWDQKSPGVLVNMWKATGDSRYLTDAQRWLTSWTPGNGITYTPGGLAWLREWGPLRYTSGSAFLALLIGTSASNTWGKGQIDYMLGSNPQSRSYVVGFGSNSPINPHHRAAHGSTTNDINNPVNNRYILTGALVGGPGANDDYVDSRQDYVKNEVACDYNAAFTAAVAALAKLSGTGPTPTTRPTSAPTNGPTTAPTTPPTTKPTSAPTSAPTTRPTSAPTSAPTSSPSGSISVELNSGVNLFWFAVKISGESQTTQKVEVKDSSPLSAWGVATATNWGFWVFSPANALVLPISLRLTSSAGQQVLINNIITSITDFSKINTNVQYGSSGPTTPPTPTPTSTPTSRPPTSPPTTRPTNAPTAAPTTAPTAAPTTRPTSAPTAAPTAAPTTRPTSAPTAAPTTRPTSAPPTAAPTTRPTTTLKVLVNPGSNAYWFALQIQDAAVTVRSVEFKDSGRITDYIAFTQESWGAWTYQAVGDKTVTGPVTVRITGTNGKTITFPVSNISPSTLTDSGLQL